MLSSRAAAFSVKALLTNPQQESKGAEDASDSRSEEEPLQEISKEESGSPTMSPGDGDSSMQEPPGGGALEQDKGDLVREEVADDDLIVDVESHSPSPSPGATSNSPQSVTSGQNVGINSSSGSPVSVICRTPSSGSPPAGRSTPSSGPVPPSHQFRDEMFLSHSPRPDWHVRGPLALGMPWVSRENANGMSEDVSIHLLQQDLWAKFHSLGTEMIITKNGRRMFPVVKVCLRGLDPEKNYMVYMDMAAVDTRRYRYVYPSSRWMVAGTGEPLGDQAPYIHPDSPASGVQWMAAPAVAFDRLKLTNNKTREARGQIILHSMQKYQPRIWVQEVGATATWAELPRLVERQQAHSGVFPETVFITVTAYQNQQITRLKIDSNPFAKGFRDTAKQKEMLDRRISASASRTPDSPVLPPGSPLLLPISFPFPPHLPYPPRIPGLPPHYTLGPLSPPISPLLLPPHPWLPGDAVETSRGGDGGRPCVPWGVADLSRAAPSLLPAAPAPASHSLFVSSLLTSAASPLPPALDLSKRKGDT